MAANKTRQNDASVEKFINSIDNEQRRNDSFEMLAMMEKITGHKAKMWGASLVGFDSYHYKYASGREGEWAITGFSPRKSAFTIYIMPGFTPYQKLMGNLGPHKTGKSCLYLKNLDAIDRDVLEQLIRSSVEDMRQKYSGV